VRQRDDHGDPMTTKPAGYVYVVIFSGGQQPGSILITPMCALFGRISGRQTS